MNDPRIRKVYNDALHAWQQSHDSEMVAGLIISLINSERGLAKTFVREGGEKLSTLFIADLSEFGIGDLEFKKMVSILRSSGKEETNEQIEEVLENIKRGVELNELNTTKDIILFVFEKFGDLPSVMLLKELLTGYGVDIDKLINTVEPASMVIDLIKLAKKGKIHDAIGRDEKIDEMVNILLQKKKNTVLLKGEAGVGKTAVIEGFAYRVANGMIPEFDGRPVFKVDISRVVAGTKYRGSLEDKFTSIIDELVKKEAIIVFEEVQQLGIGLAEGDAASPLINMVKNYINLGSPFIFTATPEVTKAVLNKDNELSRRMSTILLDEPNESETIEILNGSIKTYESFHGVTYTPEIIEYIVKMTNKHVHGNRKNPDKSFDIVDRAGVIAKRLGQKEVTEDHIKQAISEVTSIDVRSIELSTMDIEEYLNSVVIGQEEAVKVVANAIKRAQVGIRAKKDGPEAVLFFVGPTGVGKTELVKQLAEFTSRPLLTINMSEYDFRGSVSKLIGTTAGYVGYDDISFVDKVANNPNAIILIDEFEKAHPSVHDIFLRIFDEGTITSGANTDVSFRDTFIIMTSNIGTREIEEKSGKASLGFIKEFDSKNDISETVISAMNKTLRPEFRNRIDEIVVFNSLPFEVAVDIARLHVDRMVEDIKISNNIEVIIDKKVVERIATSGYSEKYGARNIIREITNQIANPLATYIISNGIKEGARIKVSIDPKSNRIRMKSLKTVRSVA